MDVVQHRCQTQVDEAVGIRLRRVVLKSLERQGRRFLEVLGMTD